MSLLQRMETRLGLTRADVTLALFLSSTAIVGFLYATFFEPEGNQRGRMELARLMAYSDSIERAERMRIEASLSEPPDSDRDLRPLDDDDLVRDRDGLRSRDLKVEDVAPIDINVASPAILDLLPGVGEKTAALIVAERPFEAPEEIMRVRGIGPKTFAKMKPWITTSVSFDQRDSLDGSGEDTTATRAAANNHSETDSDSASGLGKSVRSIESVQHRDSLDEPDGDSI